MHGSRLALVDWEWFRMSMQLELRDLQAPLAYSLVHSSVSRPLSGGHHNLLTIRMPMSIAHIQSLKFSGLGRWCTGQQPDMMDACKLLGLISVTTLACSEQTVPTSGTTTVKSTRLRLSSCWLGLVQPASSAFTLHRCVTQFQIRK